MQISRKKVTARFSEIPDVSSYPYKRKLYEAYANFWTNETFSLRQKDLFTYVRINYLYEFENFYFCRLFSKIAENNWLLWKLEIFQKEQ